MKLKFGITGLDCPNCAAKLSAMIEKEEGIESALAHAFNFDTFTPAVLVKGEIGDHKYVRMKNSF